MSRNAYIQGVFAVHLNVISCHPMTQPHEIARAWNRKQFRTPAIRRTGLPVSAYGLAVGCAPGGWSGNASGYCAAQRYGHQEQITDPNLQPDKPRLKERSDSRPQWRNPNGQTVSEGEALVCTTCCHSAPRCRTRQALHLAATAGVEVWPRHLFTKTATYNKSLIWTPGMNLPKRLYSLAPTAVFLAGCQIALRWASYCPEASHR
jgi:hypothetical protein